MAGEWSPAIFLFGVGIKKSTAASWARVAVTQYIGV